MALRQTYLSLKKHLPAESASILVMRGRGNDELAPSRKLLDDFNALKQEYESAPDGRFKSAYEYAWAKSDYEARFIEEITGCPEAMGRLERISRRSAERDIYFICYESYDKPCHRNLLLGIAERHFGAVVDYTPFEPDSTSSETRSGKNSEALLLFPD